MTPALREFQDRIEEIKANLAFVGAANRLRPRLGDVLNWGAEPHNLAVAKEFIGRRIASPDTSLSGLLVLSMSGFERFVRKIVEAAIELRHNECKSFDDVPASIRTRNLLLTGRALASSEAPRDYLSFDYAALVENLARCKPGSKEYRLNSLVFASSLQTARFDAVFDCMEHAGIAISKDDFGRSSKLQERFGTKSPRDAANASVTELDRLARTRNILAHGGDGFLAISETDLQDALDFLYAFAEVINDAVEGKRKKPVKGKK